MRKAIAVTTVLLSLCLLLSACSFQPFKPVEELMHPPYDSDRNQDLLQAFHASVDGTPVFIAPAGGDYTSAIVMKDFDLDGEDEALVFYKIKSVSDTVRMNVLELSNSEWQSVADVKGSGTAVESVQFARMDENGSFIVCWRVGTTAGRILSVFCKEKGGTSFKELATEPYAVMTVADIDGDGFEDVFYISQESDSNGTRNTATLMKLGKYHSGSPQTVVLDSVRLDSNVVRYSPIHFSDPANPAASSLMTDAVKGENSMITEVIRWNGETGELEVPFLDKNTLTNTATLRSSLIPSMDIDGDGVVEIPIQHPMAEDSSSLPQQTNETPAEPITVTEWMEEKNGSLNRKVTTAVNEKLSYIYTFREEDVGRVFIREETEDCWLFYQTEQDGSETDLFSVIPVAKTVFDEPSNERYTVVADCGENYICAYIPETGSVSHINTGELEEQFSIFSY